MSGNGGSAPCTMGADPKIPARTLSVMAAPRTRAVMAGRTIENHGTSRGVFQSEFGTDCHPRGSIHRGGNFLRQSLDSCPLNPSHGKHETPVYLPRFFPDSHRLCAGSS